MRVRVALLACHPGEGLGNPRSAPELVDIPPPEGTSTGLFSVTRIDATLGRTIRRGSGRQRVTTGLLVPPRTCRRTWRFEEIATLPGDRGTIAALDDVPCVRRP